MLKITAIGNLTNDVELKVSETIRHPARDELAPQIPEPQQEKKQRKEVER